MPPPWKTSTKAVDLTGHGLHSHLAAPIAGFTPSIFSPVCRVWRRIAAPHPHFSRRYRVARQQSPKP
jgi:hypothetical protein